MTEPFLRDLAWCWWTKPRATRIGSTVYLGALDAAGQILAATWNLTTRSGDRTVLAQFESDDHNNPAVVAVPDRPLVAFYSRHQQDDALRFRASTRPLDLTEWGPERVLRFGGETTYAQVHPYGDELHLFTRVDDATWSYCRSDDWAQTWQPPVPFLSFDTDQELYMPTVLLADGATVRVAVSGHPKEYRSKPLHDVWVCLIDLPTGAVTRPSDGAVLANLRTGSGLPLNYDVLELAHRTPAERTLNLFDVGDGPLFELGFVSKLKDDQSTRDAKYHVTSLRDGEWQTEEVVSAGVPFGYIHAGFYAGGVAFPWRTPSGQIYLTREADGLWYLERWQRQAAGGWAPRLLLGPSEVRLTRPWPVAGATGELDVVALALERYGDSYFDTLSHLVGAGRTGPYPVGRSS